MKCNAAGIDVRMICGDHKEAATEFAKECGILLPTVDYADSRGEPLRHPCAVLTAAELRAKVLFNGHIVQDRFDEVWPYLRVLADSSAEDKHMLVSGIVDSELYMARRKGKSFPISKDPQVVAVTGKTSGDVPSLHKAHVGFAMKRSSKRVVQAAADILIMDDNLESIVKSCMWG